MQRFLSARRDHTKGKTRRKDKRKHRDVCNRGCKTMLLDGPDCKMATRGIIVRTRDLPSAALSPSQRAVEVAMATDRRKPAPTLLFPRMRAVGFAVSRSLCVKWFCCAVLKLPPRRSSFFSPRIPFPLCFFAVVARRRLFARSSESQTSSRAAAPGDPVCRGFFPSAIEFPTNKRTNVTLICDIVIRSAGFGQYGFRGWIVMCTKVRKHKIWHERKHYFFALLFYTDKIFIFKQKNFVYRSHDSAQIQTTFDINFRMHMHVHTQN